MPIKTDALTKIYDTDAVKITALAPTTLSFADGSFTTIVGKSGCGKTTLLRLLAGLEEPTAGTLSFASKKPEIGFVFQEPRLMPWLTVSENIAFATCKGDMSKEKLPQLLTTLGLSAFANAYPMELSGGMAQRTALGRTLFQNPDIILMDEPFGALDPHTRQKMQKHLMDLWQNIDITIIFVTHDMDEAILLADRIVALKANPGEIKEIIEVDLPRPRSAELMSSPAFKQLRERVDFLVHAQEEELDPALEDLPKIPRMTQVSTHK